MTFEPRGGGGGEEWEKQEVVKVAAEPLARLAATVSAHNNYTHTHVEERDSQM